MFITWRGRHWLNLEGWYRRGPASAASIHHSHSAAGRLASTTAAGCQPVILSFLTTLPCIFGLR